MLRWLALAVAVAAPLAVLVVFVIERLLWVALVAAVLFGRRRARRPHRAAPGPSAWTLPVADAPDAERPFLVMNPRSGGGKVTRFDLQHKAEALGAEVALLDRPGTDVQQLARDALARGADLLGVAGGDGTQALVAQVAAEHDVPFLVISAGTRNHFALDLGLDREDPSRCLDALRDGVETRIDLGEINGRPFVNNASFGAYAEIVDNPAYRDDKRGTTLDALPDLLTGRRGAHLVGDADGQVIEEPQALLVSNNPYEATDLAGMGRRARLDGAVLGVIAVRVDSAREAAGLLHGAHRHGLLQTQAREVVVRGRGSGHPGRHRRGVCAPDRPGALHRPTRCAAGSATSPATRRATTTGCTGVGAALATGRRPAGDRRHPHRSGSGWPAADGCILPALIRDGHRRYRPPWTDRTGLTRWPGVASPHSRRQSLAVAGRESRTRKTASQVLAVGLLVPEHAIPEGSGGVARRPTGADAAGRRELVRWVSGRRR